MKRLLYSQATLVRYGVIAARRITHTVFAAASLSQIKVAWLYPAAALLAFSIHGCATSPRAHFYTLSRNGIETPADTQRALATQTPFYIEVADVEIPAIVARAQFVITDRSGEAKIKEQHRWLAPLDDQIRAALSEELTDRLHTLDVSRMPHAFSRAVYRITFDVRRFESRLDAPAAAQAEIDAIWSVRRMDENRKNARAALTCRAFARESTASDLHSISQGHRRAIGRIADQIATAIRALDAARNDFWKSSDGLCQPGSLPGIPGGR